ncbi:denitrification regulatory protein NirQ [Ferrovum sp. JA12]|uniref:AAA family ATPase n=1 Tax=Ferrovum sp. JA12 TaxID=1356299 RepID=UPI0007027B35|nr:AAA family ATPase [Ferrovum sp. JA12]KRH79759.1 denitrification regulatory protein NirQ [Ferrovum sp. JA12]
MSVIAEYNIETQHYYGVVADEIDLCESDGSARIPMILKRLTGYGRSRFVEYMGWKLQGPLIILTCNEDMIPSNPVGYLLFDTSLTRFQDGPLTVVARLGEIFYRDEVAEASQNTTFVIHPLINVRRILPLGKKGKLIHAHPDFWLLSVYHSDYQSLMKHFKQSSKQRFCPLDVNYSSNDIEVETVEYDTKVSLNATNKPLSFTKHACKLKGHSLEKGISIRMLIYADKLIASDINLLFGLDVTLVQPIDGELDRRDALDVVTNTFF